jgi:ribosomal protein L16 Arg81 hydroxylase
MITLKKKFFNFVKEFDFNSLINLLDTNDIESTFACANVHNNYVLESPFKILNAQKDKYFNDLFIYLNKEFNTKNLKSDIYLFFSFTSGGKGLAHSDVEDVHIVGLHGKTMYIVENKEHLVEKGDLLIIPKGVAHRAIGLSPRIILSFGIYG